MLVYLADLAHDYHGTLQYTPTGIGYLAAAASARLGEQVEIALFKSPTRLLDAVDARRPDLVGLTNYTWNSALGVFAAGHIRRSYPDVPIVMGGPNIRTDEPGIAEFLARHSYVDKYCMYAGETSLTQILEALLARAPRERTAADVRRLAIDGTYSLDEGRLTGNSQYYMPQDLDEVPSPFTGGWMDPFLKEGFIPIFESNRGCPFSCTFCVWGISALNKVRRFSMDRITSELAYVVESGFATPILCFGDANFGILPRDVEIAQCIRDLYDRHRSFSSVQFYWSKTLKPHMVDIGRILGHLTQTYIAFQSLDPGVLENIKRKNISTDELLGLIRRLKAFTNSTQTDILVGLPGETYASHLESLETALGYGIDLIHGGEIRMLPGAEMESAESRERFGLRTKYRLFEGGQGRYRGTFVYEVEEVIRETDAMSEAEMLDLRVLRAVFYGSVTLGEHLPVVAYLKHRGMRVTELCQRICDLGDTEPAFHAHLDWLARRAREEWFETPEDVARYFAAEANQAAMLSGDAFVKLNIGFLARVYRDPAAYDAYYRVVARALSEMVPPEDAAVVQELLSLCRDRNYLVHCLRDLPGRSTSMIVTLSPAAARLLADSGFVHPSDGCLADGRLLLEVNPTTAQICEQLAEQERQHQVSLPRLSQTLLMHAGRFLGKPRKPGTAEDLPPDPSYDAGQPVRASFPIRLSVQP